MDVIAHSTTTRRTVGAPHDEVQHTAHVTPNMHVDACAPIVTKDPFFGGRTRIRFEDRQEHGLVACDERGCQGLADHRLSARCGIAKAQKVFVEGSRDGFTPFRETDTGSFNVRSSIRS